MQNGKRLPMGKTFKVDKEYSERLINKGDAVLYNGPLPPPLMKTDFFKPKK